MITFLARFVLALLIVLAAYMGLVGYTRAVYEAGWEDRGTYEEELDEDWSEEPEEEIET